jgi:transcriptional regulator with XRE-family HTH domain
MKQPETRNLFAAAFISFHELSSLTLRELAVRCDLNAGDLSRIRAGKKRATVETLYKLIEGLPPEQACPLVAAYLKDILPPGLSKLIHITTVGKRGRDGNLSKYQEAIRTLAAMEDNPALRRHIISVAETLAPLHELGKATGKNQG